MKSIFATLAVALLVADANAHKMRSVGIFDKLYAEEAEAQALVDKKNEAIAYKKKQMIEAEKEHEQAVKEEEEDDKRKEEEDAKKFEERELLARNEAADNRRRQALAEIDAEKLQLRNQVNFLQLQALQGPEAEIVSHGQRDGIHGDVVFTNSAQDNMIEENSPMYMIGSGAAGAGMNLAKEEVSKF